MMKVVIIFCVKAFYEDLKKIYSKADIQAYSEFDVKGYTRKQEDKGESLNWFAPGKDLYDSIATFAFLTEEKGVGLMGEISRFNNGLDCCSPMHGYMLDVEKFV